MAEFTVARAQRDDGQTPQAEAPIKAEGSFFSALPRPLVVLWIALVLGIITFLLLGSLRIGAGNRLGRRMPVREIWSKFLNYLADQGASPAVVIAVAAAAGITLIAAGLALWLAFALNDERPDIPDELTGM